MTDEISIGEKDASDWCRRITSLANTNPAIGAPNPAKHSTPLRTHTELLAQTLLEPRSRLSEREMAQRRASSGGGRGVRARGRAPERRQPTRGELNRSALSAPTLCDASVLLREDANLLCGHRGMLPADGNK